VPTILLLAGPARSEGARRLDIVLYDFFRAPRNGFEDYWARRASVWWRDLVLHDAFPYLLKYTPEPGKDPGNYFLMRNYRMAVHGRSLPEMSIDSPVFLPRLGRTTASGGFANATFEMAFVNRTRWDALVAAGKLSLTWNYNDGFVAELRARVVMDALGAEKVLGLQGDPLAWWSSNSAKVTEAWAAWLDTEGNDRLDVYSALRLPFAELYTSLDLTLADGWIVLTVDHVSWGIDALLSRWMYWGTADYLRAAPAGFLPFEMRYDHLSMTLNVSATADVDLDTEVDYGLRAWVPSRDSEPFTDPAWVWQPTLLDVIRSNAEINPRSELDAYAGRTYLHRTPGSPRFNAALPYEYVPVAVDLEAGETLRMEVGRDRWWFLVPPWAEIVPMEATLTSSVPDLALAWDGDRGVLQVTGPFSSNAPAYPAFGMPWLELGLKPPGGDGLRRHP